MNARNGRPAAIGMDGRLTEVDPSENRAALPPGHAVSLTALAPLTPSIALAWPRPSDVSAQSPAA